ncbi:MAG: hypothetical protein K1Y02_20875 [Candidatus Hydrogenedentes bacterium]|nr:hypothetical protein [Candidatus Hydrogenedentota bacterium]
MRSTGGFRVFLMLAFVLFCCQVHAANVFSFTSSPTSWVGQGQSRVMTEADGFEFHSVAQFWDGFSCWVNNWDSAPPEDETDWTLLLFPPTGQTLSVGMYWNAERYPSATTAGMDFSGEGRGHNMSAGYFEILEIEYGPGGAPTKLAVDFYQYGDDIDSYWPQLENWARGSIRYNSDIPLNDGPGVPALTFPGVALVLALMSCLGCRYVRLASTLT